MGPVKKIVIRISFIQSFTKDNNGCEIIKKIPQLNGLYEGYLFKMRVSQAVVCILLFHVAKGYLNFYLDQSEVQKLFGEFVLSLLKGLFSL